MKFLDKVETYLFNHGQRVLPDKYLYIETKEEDNSFSFDTQKIYKINLQYQYSGYCYPKDIYKLKDLFLDQIKHEFYGELIEDLLESLKLCYENETEECKNKFQDILTKIKV